MRGAGRHPSRRPRAIRRGNGPLVFSDRREGLDGGIVGTDVAFELRDQSGDREAVWSPESQRGERLEVLRRGDAAAVASRHGAGRSRRAQWRGAFDIDLRAPRGSISTTTTPAISVSMKRINGRPSSPAKR